jgi:hypothetical protein
MCHINEFSSNLNQLAYKGNILVPGACRRRATFISPGIHGTGSARYKLTVVSKAHALEFGGFSTRNNFHSEVLREETYLC